MGDAEQVATPKPSPPRDLTGTTIGRFAIRTRLGGGGMGEVYRAEDTKLKRPVALKRVTPAHGNREHFRRRFLREAECASRINDRHIAGVYDVLEENGELYLVMEYVEGQTLRERICQPMTLGEFLEIAIQCAEALAAAHARDVVHRDIKPDNIMLTPGGEVKVLDFGVAKHLPRSDQGDTSDSLQSRSTSFSGTPAYMAPEVLLEKNSDGRADIFSLGTVFYEALTGRHPFLADSFMATSNRILNYTPPPPSHFNPAISEEADRIVGKMLAKEPRARYATAADLLVDLNALSRGLEHPDRLLRRPEAARPAPLWAIGATAAVLLVMVAGAVPSIRQPILEGVGIKATIPIRRTLVVLPCRAISADQAAQVYCDGLTESLTERLARSFNSRGVQVAPAREVRTRRVTKAAEARLELDAVAALEIVLSQTGDTVQIEYALLDTKTEQALDRQSVRSEASDPFALEEEEHCRQVPDGPLAEHLGDMPQLMTDRRHDVPLSSVGFHTYPHQPIRSGCRQPHETGPQASSAACPRLDIHDAVASLNRIDHRTKGGRSRRGLADDVAQYGAGAAHLAGRGNSGFERLRCRHTGRQQAGAQRDRRRCDPRAARPSLPRIGNNALDTAVTQSGRNPMSCGAGCPRLAT